MTIPGIDVSHWQGAISWPAVAASGVQFALIAAGDMDGEPLDLRFAQNWAGARAAGIARGAYWFCRPELGPPETDAAAFLAALATVGPLQVGDVLAGDFETGDGDTGAWARTWLETVAAAVGFRPLCYTGPSYAAEHGFAGQAGLAEYGLWIADYGVTSPIIPAPWSFHAVWQYSDSGTLPGILASVDRNAFNGADIAQFAAYGLPQPADPCAGLATQLTAVTADRDRLRSILGQIAIEAQGAAVEGT